MIKGIIGYGGMTPEEWRRDYLMNRADVDALISIATTCSSEQMREWAKQTLHERRLHDWAKACSKVPHD